MSRHYKRINFDVEQGCVIHLNRSSAKCTESQPAPVREQFNVHDVHTHTPLSKKEKKESIAT